MMDFEGYRSAIAKIVGHHDGGIQRSKIQSSNWLVIITNFGIQYLSKQNLVSSLILVLRNEPKNRNRMYALG